MTQSKQRASQVTDCSSQPSRPLQSAEPFVEEFCDFRSTALYAMLVVEGNISPRFQSLDTETEPSTLVRKTRLIYVINGQGLRKHEP